MNSPDLQTVVIACPNCGTRYQVPYATIGAAGREVQCAQCSLPWHATASMPPPPPIEDDVLFSPGDEIALDQVFEAEAHAVAPVIAGRPPSSVVPERTLADIRTALAPKPKKGEINALDPVVLDRTRQAFDRRQARISSATPMARLRRTARHVTLLLLAGLLVLGIAKRTDLVASFPALAGLYAAIGLPVNVVGLEFQDNKTLTSFRGGKPAMLITSRIRSVASTIVEVPPVLVSLIDANGATIYEWTVTPRASRMAPGEIFDFSTEVSAPPPGAVTVRLSFATPRAPISGTATSGTL